jgi:uncharacterized Tic20 family protein
VPHDRSRPDVIRERGHEAAIDFNHVGAVVGALDLANRANEALTRVGSVIAATSSIAGDLAARAASMTTASTGLARNMGSVSSVVEENAAAAGQMRTTANALLEHAHGLRRVVSEFRVQGLWRACPQGGSGAHRLKHSRGGVAMSCPHCGTETTARFCPNCGAAVAPDARLAAPQPPVPGGQPPMRVVTTLPPADAKNWAMGTHLAALSGMFIPFANVIGPLVVWLIKKDESPLVDREGKESLNFQISMTIYLCVSALLVIVLIGLPLLFVIALLDLIFTIIAAVKTSNGEQYRYPLTIRFLK